MTPASIPGTADAPRPEGGLFVTFEGGDGVGKTTQAALLEEWLTGEGRTVVRTRETPGPLRPMSDRYFEAAPLVRYCRW